jgi:hypothetical protein
MTAKQTPGEHWDRDQMERDTEGAPTDGTPQGEVWNRHQMETDDTTADRDETLQRTDVDEATQAGGLSGGGQPSGESHWDRVDRGDSTD